MTKTAKPKRKKWAKEQKEKKKLEEERPAKYCEQCGRRFYPKDPEADTCKICLNNLYFDVSEDGVIKQSPAEPAPTKNQKGKIPCKGCKEPFESEGAHNRYCESCRDKLKNVSIFAEPCSQGNHSRTD